MANPLTVSATASPSTGQAPLEVTLDAITNNPGASWLWDLDGITIGTSKTITYTFMDQGTQTVTVQVLDIHGGLETSKPIRIQVKASKSGLDIAVDLAVEDTPTNSEYRYLKFYGSGDFNSFSRGISVNIPSTINNPNETGFRRGRGPAILFD